MAKMAKVTQIFFANIKRCPHFPKHPQIFFAFYTGSVPFSHWKWDLKKFKSYINFSSLKNLTKFLDRPSKILVLQIFGPFQKSVKIFANPTKFAKILDRSSQIFGQIDAVTIQIFRIWMGQTNFLTWFSPPRSENSQILTKFLSKSGQKIPSFSEFFVPFLEIFLMEISKKGSKIWNLFQILERNSVRIPLICQIPLWRIWQIRENFKYLKFSEN
jgi:hypothetical protein